MYTDDDINILQKYISEYDIYFLQLYKFKKKYDNYSVKICKICKKEESVIYSEIKWKPCKICKYLCHNICYDKCNSICDDCSYIIYTNIMKIYTNYTKIINDTCTVNKFGEYIYCSNCKNIYHVDYILYALLRISEKNDLKVICNII